jgi:hypothetical protein
MNWLLVAWISFVWFGLAVLGTLFVFSRNAKLNNTEKIIYLIVQIFVILSAGYIWA